MQISYGTGKPTTGSLGSRFLVAPGFDNHLELE